MKKPKSLISKIWNVFLKLTFKSRKKKKNVEGNAFIFIFIYCFFFLTILGGNYLSVLAPIQMNTYYFDTD